MLFGVAIASLAKNPYLAIALAFLSHYFLDLFPHIEYDVEGIHPVKSDNEIVGVATWSQQFNWVKNKDWKKAAPAFLRVTLDGSLGLLLISIFANKSLIIFIAAFFAILPDGLSLLSSFFPNRFFDFHNFFHQEKIHFLKDNKKISNFWRIASQVAAVIISIIILRKI